jgi:hypothetical protein
MTSDELHCRVQIEGEHEPHEHESLIGGRRYWCPGGDPPPLPAGPYTEETE